MKKFIALALFLAVPAFPAKAEGPPPALLEATQAISL